MEEKYYVQFSRGEAEAKRIIFGKSFKKQILGSVVVVIALAPLSYFYSMFFVIATQQILGLGDQGTGILTVIWIYFILFPFIRPIIKIYRYYKKQLNDLFRLTNEIKSTFEFSDEGLFFKNETYEIKTQWDNLRLFKAEKDYVSFQIIYPTLQFWIPADKVSKELSNFLESKIIQK